MRKSQKYGRNQIIFVLIPLSLSSIFLITHSVITIVLAVASLFILVSVLPICRRRENLFMFVFSGISLLPANIYFSLLTAQWLESEWYYNGFIKITAVLLVVNILFCVEEIIFAVLTRIIFRRQYKVNLD